MGCITSGYVKNSVRGGETYTPPDTHWVPWANLSVCLCLRLCAWLAVGQCGNASKLLECNRVSISLFQFKNLRMSHVIFIH